MYEMLFGAKVKPQDQDAFVAFFNENIRLAEMREPGTLRFEVYQEDHQDGQGEANTFLVHEAYLDEAAFKAHQENEPFKRWECEWIRDKRAIWFARSRFGKPVLSLARDRQ